MFSLFRKNQKQMLMETVARVKAGHIVPVLLYGLVFFSLFLFFLFFLFQLWKKQVKLDMSRRLACFTWSSRFTALSHAPQLIGGCVCDCNPDWLRNGWGNACGCFSVVYQHHVFTAHWVEEMLADYMLHCRTFTALVCVCCYFGSSSFWISAALMSSHLWSGVEDK